MYLRPGSLCGSDAEANKLRERRKKRWGQALKSGYYSLRTQVMVSLGWNQHSPMSILHLQKKKKKPFVLDKASVEPPSRVFRVFTAEFVFWNSTTGEKHHYSMQLIPSCEVWSTANIFKLEWTSNNQLHCNKWFLERMINLENLWLIYRDLSGGHVI